MTFDQLLALGTTLGVGGALGTLAKGAAGYVRGHAQREKEANQDLASQRDRAWALVEAERKRADAAEAEAQAVRRQADEDVRQANIRKRQALELASCLRGRMLQQGLPVDDWPTDLY